MVKLISINLSHFKGIDILAVNFNGQNVKISGPNGCGKTTIADAYLWLIGGVSYADGRKLDEDIKRKDIDGNPAVDGGVEHAVEMVLDVDGTKKIYKKVYAEKWGKKRGSANKEMSGHTTSYFLNGMSTTKGVYDKELKAIHADVLAMIARPQSFSEMDTKKKRAMLIEILGGQAVPMEYPEAVQRYIDTYGDLNSSLDAVTHDIACVNKKLDELPVRIDEAMKNVPGEVDTTELEKDIDNLKKQLQELHQYANNINKDSRRAELENKLNRLRAEQTKVNHIVSDMVWKEKSEHEKRISNLNDKLKSLEMQLSSAQEQLKKEKDHNALLVQSWKDERAKTADIQITCPTCGQEIPPEKIEEAKKAFNMAKAERMKEIGAAGKKSKDILVSATKAVEDLTSHIEAVKEEVKKEQSVEVTATLAKRQDMIELAERADSIDGKISAVQKEIDDKEDYSGTAKELEKVNQEICKVENDLAHKMEVKAKVDLRSESLKRIDELRKEQKEYAVRYDDLIEVKQRMENVVKKIVDDMHTKIAEKFQYARFCMYKKQVNGGIAECCEVLNKDGVPLATSANTASRILANMDISRVIGEHYGVYGPMFVDNGESVIHGPAFKGFQTIVLSVKDVPKMEIQAGDGADVSIRM